MKVCFLIVFVFASFFSFSQDTSVSVEDQVYILPEVFVRDSNYADILRRIQKDTSFYKAFKTLHTVGFSAYNNITMLDKEGMPEASYNSKTVQHVSNGCRTMTEENKITTGDFYDKKGGYNYMTAQMYASLFFTAGTACGETNVVGNMDFDADGKTGMEKHKAQLKMLFFNPGKKIPGIPFIGNKLDLYDARAHQLYDYRLDYIPYRGSYAYLFSIKPKPDAASGDMVIDEMTTWFDPKTMEVLARNYQLSYKAGLYDFNVNMQVELTRINNILLPQTLRYKGDFHAIFHDRERGEFTATLFDFKL
ncbi:MAG: hypothetical protein M3R72_09850 [Bacteroidota bacterium]|nr:hypothetical protein [Bacteroidota bacterium]